MLTSYMNIAQLSKAIKKMNIDIYIYQEIYIKKWTLVQRWSKYKVDVIFNFCYNFPDFPTSLPFVFQDPIQDPIQDLKLDLSFWDSALISILYVLKCVNLTL